MRNPYYRYQLAREAIEVGDHDTAISHLKYAIGRKKDEDRFYHLLGLCHLKMGDEAAAQMWLERAKKVAASDTLKRKYASKIDMLLTTGVRQKQ
jgi:tetratricopeptide (TPR) repeat protein